MKSFCKLQLSQLLVLVLFGCGAAADLVPCDEDPRCLRYGISVDIPVLDPHIADTPEAGMIFRQIYDTLVYRDTASHEFLPGLATSWDVSADGMSYTFSLQQDVTFHDGARFTAQAVAANIDRIFDPANPLSLARELLGPLSRYEVLDDFTIRLHLFSPHSALLDALAQPYLGIASPLALQGYDQLRYQFHQSGTGPFMLESYTPGERILLRRFADYVIKPGIYAPLTGAEINQAEFVITREQVTDALALLGETLDIIDDLAPVDAQTLSGNSRVQILPTAIAGQSVQFLFNSNRQHLRSREARRSLLLATNRIALSDQAYFNFSPVAWAPLSTSTGFAHTGYTGSFAYDQKQAQAILAAEGYADSDADGILDRDGAPLELKIVVPPWGELPNVAALLREQWRLIGIDLRLEPVPGKTRLQSLVQSGEYDLLPIENYGIDPSLLGRIFLDDSLYRFSREPDPQLTDMLLTAAKETDALTRRNQYYEIQAILMNEVLILPIRDNLRLTAARAEIRNLHFDAYGFYPLLFNTMLENG